MQLSDFSVQIPFFLENKSTVKEENKMEYICCISQLQKHLADKEKAQRYNKMLDEMGMEKEFFSNLRKKPSFIYSEQPNPLFLKNTRPTFRLLKELISFFEVDNDNSGVFTLNNDRFTMGGLKKESNIMCLLSELKTVSIADKKFISENEGKAYKHVVLSKDDAESISSVFKIFLMILEAANADYHSFMKYIHKMPHVKLPRIKRIDDFLQHGIDLITIHEKIKKIDLEKLKTNVRFIIDSVYEGRSWAGLWTEVNSKILNIKIRPADPLLNKYILAIKDPHKYMRWYADATGKHMDEPLAILNFVDISSGYHQTLFYDFNLGHVGDGKCFFYYRKEDSAKIFMDFAEVKTLAEQNLTGGPMYIAKYLLRAASNTYFLIHTGDMLKNTKNDDLLSKLHEDLIGTTYPWVTLKPWQGDNEDVAFVESSMLTNYDSRQIGRNSQRIKRFFLE